jgi:type VI secretion system secreted protein VgrG
LAIDSSSADIKSTNVTFKADANLKLEAAAQLDAKGAMVKIEGDAMADLKSPMTTVNGSGMLTLGGGLIKMG